MNSMEGGRYLGSGTYGCVFTPPLLCKSGKQPSQELVGKITLDKIATQEVLIGNRLRKFPLVKNYIVLPEPESCELAPEEQQEDPGLQECREDFKRHGEVIDVKHMSQVTSPFAGTKAFWELFLDQSIHPKRFDFFRFMRQILEAGSLMLLAGVCHFDLHAGNLMVDKFKTVRIIDLGLAFLTDKITIETVNGRWKRLRFGFEPDASHPSIHNSEPPELTVMNAIRRNEYSLENAINLTVVGKEIFRDIQTTLGISKQRSTNEMLKFWVSSDYARKRNFVRLWQTYWPGFDAWSIGCLIQETLSALLLFPEFTEGEYRTKKASVLAALHGLLDPNPRNRLDCMEALFLFDPGNKYIERFGKQWLAARKRQRSGKN